MKNFQKLDDPIVAVLITGTYRELDFLLELIPHLCGRVNHDIFLVIRHVISDESSRLGSSESDFNLASLSKLSSNNVFICELPCIDTNFIKSNFILPVGPTDVNRECGMISMFYGVFAGIAMIKASQRPYTHVMKTRTDYLPWVAPWLEKMLMKYNKSNNKIVVDGVMTKAQRYPDRTDIPWQGSISDSFCFANYDQFLNLWNFEDKFHKVWTGIPETTLFRTGMLNFIGDELQSSRRNESFLKNYFTWDVNDTKQSFYLIRAGVFSKEIKKLILKYIEQNLIKGNNANKLIRITYDYIGFHLSNKNTENKFIIGTGKLPKIKEFLQKYLSKENIAIFIKECDNAIDKGNPL